MIQEESLEEIMMWRKRFLGDPLCDSEKEMQHYFLDMPCLALIKNGPEQCYKDSVKAFLYNLKGK